MDITTLSNVSPWLLLVFTLPASKASERVRIWRKLQRIGAIPFRNAGSMLPNAPDHRERFEWLATAVREFKGEASILEVHSVDDLPVSKLKERFREARAAEYTALLTEIEKLAKGKTGKSQQSGRLRRRFEEIVAIDFFESPLRVGVEEALMQIDSTAATSVGPTPIRASKSEYQKRTWVTRPCPGIDRVSSAWLIVRFIDSKAKFVFAAKPSGAPDAVPFDMYSESGFRHQGDRCTFETLCHAFQVTDKRVAAIGQAIHDADLDDDKYGRSEGHTLNRILKGWAQSKITDQEILQRGMDLIQGLYDSSGTEGATP